MAISMFRYDACAIDKPLLEFIQKFYSLADDLSRMPEWANCFTENASLKRGVTTVVGREAILKTAIANTKDLVYRRHSIEKIFPFGPGAPDDVMLCGKAAFETKDGVKIEIETAARIRFARSDDGTIRIDLYQLYPILPARPT
ncbi:hypothetical protein F4809DRAFT_643686 [Biscogniauxia mediterranea]|nr:hypothetical protein F4809DRAFT_643686 [Biscogniauxia mediterranea]